MQGSRLIIKSCEMVVTTFASKNFQGRDRQGVVRVVS